MNSGPFALIVASKLSNWTSCKTITRNLGTAYQRLLGKKNARFFQLPDQPDEAWSIAEKIHACRPSRLVILDHAPHPLQLIEALKFRYGSKPLPPIYFHVYGDFTLFPSEWMKLNQQLLGHPVAFVCASSNQMRLVSRFLIHPEGSVFRCPFPVDTNLHRFDPARRLDARHRFGIKDDEFVFFYAGRISMQKNVVRLLSELDLFLKTTKARFRFLWAGDYDSLGAPFFGVKVSKGDYFNYFQQTLVSCSRRFQQQAQYLGTLKTEDLIDLNHVGDTYLSLSLHHDEDYGMSPAEALCTGTTGILTDWGGFHDFGTSQPSGCDLVPVRIGSKGLAMDLKKFQDLLVRHRTSRGAHTLKMRTHRAQAYQDQFSIEYATQSIANIHSMALPRFQGFGWLMDRYRERFNTGAPYVQMTTGTLYQEVYGNYIASPS